MSSRGLRERTQDARQRTHGLAEVPAWETTGTSAGWRSGPGRRGSPHHRVTARSESVRAKRTSKASTLHEFAIHYHDEPRCASRTKGCIPVRTTTTYYDRSTCSTSDYRTVRLLRCRMRRAAGRGAPEPVRLQWAVAGASGTPPSPVATTFIDCWPGETHSITMLPVHSTTGDQLSRRTLAAAALSSTQWHSGAAAPSTTCHCRICPPRLTPQSTTGPPRSQCRTHAGWILRLASSEHHAQRVVGYSSRTISCATSLSTGTGSPRA